MRSRGGVGRFERVMTGCKRPFAALRDRQKIGQKRTFTDGGVSVKTGIDTQLMTS
jgi:hypothetical protein